MICPKCHASDNRIIDSRETSKGLVDRRRHECRCGVRWTSRAVMEPDSIATTDSGFKRRFNTTYSAVEKPPDTTNCTPRTTNSGGGVGGGLPPVQGLISLSDTEQNSRSNQAGARKSNGQAKEGGVFVRCRDTFVAAWEEAYEEKCPFERQDAVALAAMLKKHPEYGMDETWREMIFRYLGNDFYGSKRHPLVFLASKAREFAGEPRNGVPQRVAASRATTRAWAERERSSG